MRSYRTIFYATHARRLWPILGVLLLLCLPLTAWAQEDDPLINNRVLVSAHLRDEFATAQGPVSFLIVLRDQVDPQAFLAQNALVAASRNARAAALYDEMTGVAQRTQAPLRAWLDAQGIPYRAFYLVNMIEVRADLATATALRRRPEIDRLVSNPQVTQLDKVSSSLPTLNARPRFQPLAVKAEATAALPYGLDATNAPDVWALGYTGQNIVVASQDTGVQWDHPALKMAYRGVISPTITFTNPLTVTHVYNWYDAWGVTGRPNSCDQDPQIPCDDDGHGTHTVGTMVGDATADGDTVLGMAPAAQWIGCRNMHEGVGTPASYTACFEFFLAPYPQGGDPFTDGRPEFAPNIINNSWGCPPSEGCDADSLHQVVIAMRAAGQLVVASAGNKGSSCGTVQDPAGIYDEVFSVGAHDSSGTIASFSSRGPVVIDGSGRMKPDISAPGVNVRSSSVGNSYRNLSGTSMASPHTAGAVALLWSALPALIGNIDATEQILIKSAAPVPVTGCGISGTAAVPNNIYGFGRLDILAAVEIAQQPATLRVQVVNRNGAAQPAVDLTLTDRLTGYNYTATTIFTGIAYFPTLYAGDYELAVADSPTLTQSVTLLASAQQQLTVTLPLLSNTYLPLITR